MPVILIYRLLNRESVSGITIYIEKIICFIQNIFSDKNNMES